MTYLRCRAGVLAVAVIAALGACGSSPAPTASEDAAATTACHEVTADGITAIPETLVARLVDAPGSVGQVGRALRMAIADNARFGAVNRRFESAMDTVEMRCGPFQVFLKIVRVPPMHVRHAPQRNGG